MRQIKRFAGYAILAAIFGGPVIYSFAATPVAAVIVYGTGLALVGLLILALKWID